MKSCILPSMSFSDVISIFPLNFFPSKHLLTFDRFKKFASENSGVLDLSHVFYSGYFYRLLVESPSFELELKPADSSKKYVFASEEGVKRPEEVLDTEVTLLNNISVKNTDAILVLDSRLGVEGVVLGDRVRNGRVMMSTSQAREALLSELNRRKNSPEASCEIMLSSNVSRDCLRKYDKIVYSPREGDPIHLAKDKIMEASTVLREDGEMFISSNQKLNSELNKFLGKKGKVTEIIDGDRSVLKASNFSGKYGEEALEISKLKHTIKGEKIRFKCIKGFFDSGDMRTVEMIVRELSAAKRNGDFLDATVGPGLTAIYADLLYDMNSSFISDDVYDKDFALKNSRINDVELEAFVDDGLEVFQDKSFDTIALSPDENVSVKEFENLIDDCFRVLRPGGKVFIIHRKDFPVERNVRKSFSSYNVCRREYGLQVVSASKE